MIVRATKKQTKVAMERNKAILNKIRSILRPIGYHFQDDIVGSKCFNTILVKNDEPYDIDVRIVLTHNTKEEDAEIIFDDFKNAFNKIANDNLKISFGTQAIKCSIYNRNKIQYKIEYLISKEGYRIRVNKPQGKRHWHEMKESYEDAYERFSNYSAEEREIIIQEYVLPLKIAAIELEDQKPSIALFLEGLNNYENER